MPDITESRTLPIHIRYLKGSYGTVDPDLSYVTPEVRQLQPDSGHPGMKVLQFAFDSREASVKQNKNA